MPQITQKTKPDTEKSVEAILNPTVKQWFYSRFKKFSLPQLYGVSEIHSRNNILVSAPTGATKTLTGFLSVLNELVDSAEKGILEDRIYCVYISPLKALNYDIEVNLNRPLKEIEEIAGKELGIRVGVRTGDTTASEKAKMLRKPPHILITTPESLAIMLASTKFRENLKNVDWCIIDEIHALAESKRGVHLSLSLENLSHIAKHVTRVGLSATVAPLDEVAKFLVGSRDCKIVDVQFIKELDLQVTSPVKNLIDSEFGMMHHKMYSMIDKMVQEHKTTLIFTNTRAATERVVHYLKEKFPKKYTDENIGAHHGSLSKELRHSVEQRLRDGKIKVVVSSTSLELGIDIGFIDLVLLLGSPKSVARALQRIGRSGHQLHATTKGRIIVLDRDDLVECSVLLKSAKEKKIDRLHIPTNCLDVLAQQIDGFVMDETWETKDLYEVIKKSYCYSDLRYEDYVEILDYLAGKFISLESQHIYAKIWYKDNKIGRRSKLGRVIYMTNIGTIPDETSVTVKIGDQKIGNIDEGFLEKLRRGDVFVLGGSTYEFKFARGMTAQVNSSVDRPPTVPSWVSEMLPLSFDLSVEIGKFRKYIEERMKKKESKEKIIKFINDYLYVDANAAEAIYNYFKEQYDYVKEVPSNKKILIEHYEEEGNKRIIFHSLFGRRVNDVLSRAVAFAISKQQHRDVDIGMNDNGFWIGGEKKIDAVRAMKALKAEELEALMKQAIDDSEVLRRRFRHCATRALMILRNYMGKKKRVGRQQVGSMILISAVKRISEDFTILKEARREVLEDLMDISNAMYVVKEINDGRIKLKEINTTIPTPFAFNLALQGFMDILKVEDKTAFLKRMHQMLIAKIALSKDVDHETKKMFREYQKKVEKQSEDLVVKYRNEIEFLNKDSKKLTKKQREMILQVDKADKRLPIDAKLEIIKMIKGSEEVDGEVIERIIEYKQFISKRWPSPLSKFVIKRAEQLKFNYVDLWEEYEEKREEKAEQEIEKLLKDFEKAARKIDLEPKVRYELEELIRNKVDKASSVTQKFLEGLFSGAIPKVWTDRLIKKLKEIKEKVS